ncbi:TraR/DksA C4-type zinc finger protein [Pseudonocardia kujensis]|uniref:TraR/DksA family transcriptional regulator n=1 Tax=Pseudonocardia kujensis TaxID=1128675 RepID=UPI001E2D2232|nr:TraR/DksA C4-type zinc finger protein [Pseudonocardia kujensis]MCE0767913.1 TraR/DksA C4-type zinc finger protein [Pseudonocardia kujensis]
MNTTQAREMLTAELERLDHEAGEEAREQEEQRDSDELAGGMDFGDRGSRETEAMEDDLARGTLRMQRAQVVAALERIDAGSYGRCAVCGKQIDDERLEARPETDKCRDHADTATPAEPGDVPRVDT